MATLTHIPANASAEADPHRDVPGEAPGATLTSGSSETVDEKSAGATIEQEDTGNGQDQEQAPDSSTYGFGTPAQGFGQRRAQPDAGSDAGFSSSDRPSNG